MPRKTRTVEKSKLVDMWPFCEGVVDNVGNLNLESFGSETRLQINEIHSPNPASIS